MLSTTVFTETGTMALTGVATVGLVVLLIAAELAGAGEGDMPGRLRRNAVVYAIPLLMVFVVTAVVALIHFMTG